MPAGRVNSAELTAFRKARNVSSFQNRRRLRDLQTSSILPDMVSPIEGPARARPSLADALASHALSTVATLTLVWVATVSLVVLNYFLPINLVSLIYLLPVVVAATQWGIAAGLFAAVSGALAADFFFYPPLYTFWIREPQQVVDLILFLLVAVVTSNLAARLKNEADILSSREREIRELHAFSQGLATCLNTRDLIFAVQDYLSNTLRYRAVLIARQPTDAIADDSNVPAEVRRQAERLMAVNAPRAVSLTEPRSGKSWLIRVIAPDILGYGAIAVELGDSAPERVGAIAHRVEALLDEAIVTLKHLKVKEAIEQATINYRTEVLRDALVGGVSHELRSPLTSILGSCSVLDRIPAVVGDDRARSLVAAISDQAGQLDGQIRDLLDASRISAKGVRPQLMWSDPTDIVQAALKQKERRLASHWVTLDLARDAPLVCVDQILVEQALGQLLENAAKYSPIGSEIRISSRRDDDHLVFSVRDQGSGLTTGERGQVGRKSFRGPRQTGAGGGSGLGLWIASTFVAANGGSLHAESPGPDLGSTISLRLPIASDDTAELVDALDELDD